MKNRMFTVLVTISILVLATGCSSQSSSMVLSSALQNSTVSSGETQSKTSEQQSVSQTGTTSASSSELIMTLDELSKYDGKNGNPAYVAVDGVIYDVTNVPQWAGGEHNGNTAGQDLTEVINNQSPHGLSALDGLPVVGKLAA